MKLTSQAFEQGGKIPRKYTCQGENVSIPLEIRDVPKNAVTLALIMDDPDVPEWVRKEKMYDHWIVFNIKPETKEIDENDSGFGVSGKNTGGKNEYTGPCPPDGEHRYFFRLYALDCTLSLKEGATKDEVLRAMEGHILTVAELMGTYIKT